MRIKAVESKAEWQMAHAIRQRVFVEEQNCPPEEEWDAYDDSSRHFIGLEVGEPVATARWRVVVWEQGRAAKLERFAVVPEARGKGLGRTLVSSVIEDAERNGFLIQVIHAQAHLQRFYESFGFEPRGHVFIEAGIPHITMVREADRATGKK